MKKEFAKFVISQVAILIRNDKCLILKFSDLDGKWGLPGGRVDVGELGEPAFRREIVEELGMDNFKNIAVVDYGMWTVPFATSAMSAGTSVCGIANLIENENDQIKLSHEHSEYRWVSGDELGDYDFLWQAAPEMIKKGFAYKKLLDKANGRK